MPTGTEICVPGVRNLHPAAQAVGRTHRNGAHHAITELLLNLEGQVRFGEGVGHVLELQGVIYLGHRITRELDVHHGADALNDRTLTHRHILNSIMPYTAAAPPTISDSSLVIAA
jgi:hypothetical protein